MAGNDYSKIGMILAIIAGISFIVAALFLFMAMSALSAYGPYASMATGILLTGAILSIVAGVVEIIAGMLIKNPSKRMIGSILALVFGIVGIFGGGGMLLTGTILGVVAGVLGLISKA